MIEFQHWGYGPSLLHLLAILPVFPAEILGPLHLLLETSKFKSFLLHSPPAAKL